MNDFTQRLQRSQENNVSKLYDRLLNNTVQKPMLCSDFQIIN